MSEDMLTAALHEASSARMLACQAHLAPLCQLPSHDPVQYVWSHWHIENAAWEHAVPYCVILPVSHRDFDVRSMGAAFYTPPLAKVLKQTAPCKQEHLLGLLRQSKSMSNAPSKH